MKEGNALVVDGAEIGGSVSLNKDFESSGAIRLPGSKIKGDLECSGAKLNVGDGDALSTDGAEIGGNVFLCEGFESSGTIRLQSAKIGGDLAFLGAKTTKVDCTNLRLSGDMFWMRIQKPGEAFLILSGATLRNLYDDRESWPHAENLILDGLTYQELTHHGPPSAAQIMSHSSGPELPFNGEERIKWLMLQPEKVREKPQPWMQLRDLLERKGDRKGSKHVLFRFHRLQAENEGFLRRRWAIAFAWLEEAPGRIWRSIACVLLLGWLVFGYAGSHGALAPTEAEAYKAFIAGSPPPSAYPRLNPFLYTLDNAVPLVKLGQDEKWAPDRRYPETNWFTNYWFLVWSRVVLIYLGWFQSGVLGAALLRRFKEQMEDVAGVELWEIPLSP